MQIFKATTILTSLFLTHKSFGKWMPISERWKQSQQIVNSSIFEYVGGCKPPAICALVSIQTGPLSGATQLEAFLVDDGNMNTSTPAKINSTRFTVQDEESKKVRLEATNCFVTAEDLRRHGVDPHGEESKMLQALHFIDQNCSGAALAASAAVPTSINVSYSLYLPQNFSSKAQGIIGQFHGRPDPRIFLDPTRKTIVRMTTSQAYDICHNATRKSICKEGKVFSGPYDGWLYKQGGYPPLMFGYVPDEDNNPEAKGGGWWYVYGRSDNRVYIPKANCPFNAGKSYWPDKKICPSANEIVNGIWRVPFSTLPLGHWLDFEWRVTWSAYAPGGGATLTNGSVVFRILDGGANVSDQTTGTRGTRVLADVAWTGPLGRHDDGRAPFFKFGFYDPSGKVESVGPMEFRDYKQSTRVDSLSSKLSE